MCGPGSAAGGVGQLGGSARSQKKCTHDWNHLIWIPQNKENPSSYKGGREQGERTPNFHSLVEDRGVCCVVEVFMCMCDSGASFLCALNNLLCSLHDIIQRGLSYSSLRFTFGIPQQRPNSLPLADRYSRLWHGAVVPARQPMLDGLHELVGQPYARVDYFSQSGTKNLPLISPLRHGRILWKKRAHSDIRFSC
jgi:hypothetical protein